MQDKYSKHKQKSRRCEYLDRSVGSDWVTCLNDKNPTAIKVCSDEHCPMKTLVKECVARQYTIEVDLRTIMDSDAYLENENKWESHLFHMLDKIPGVGDVDYNGHFGNYVWLTIESHLDNDNTWELIMQAIHHSYNWFWRKEI